MEAPQAPYIHVQFDSDANLWQLFHTLTEERARLSAGPDPWESPVDDDQAVCLIREGEALWVNQVLSAKVLQDDGNQFFVLSGDGNDEAVCTLQRYHERHRDDSLGLTVPSGACSISFSKFEVTWGGCKFFWHLGSIWEAARCESALRVSQWLESWWPWWQKFAGKLLVPADVHLRRAAPTRKCKTGFVDAETGMTLRVLPVAACSTWFLVALLSRLSARGGKQSTKKKDTTVTCFKTLFEAFLATCALPSSSTWRFRIFMDQHVICGPTELLSGHCPAEVRVDKHGTIDLVGLADCGEAGCEFLSDLGEDKIGLCELMCYLYEGSAKTMFLFRQFVTQVAARCERKLDRAGQPRNADGQGPLEADSVSATGSHDMERLLKRLKLTSATLAPLAKAVALRLSRSSRLKYFFALRRTFTSGQFVSVCLGGSRVRRQGVLVSAIANPANTAAWMPPQVPGRTTEKRLLVCFSRGAQRLGQALRRQAPDQVRLHRTDSWGGRLCPRRFGLNL